MSTKCKFKNGMQVFSDSPQMISAGGNKTSNQTLATSTTQTVLITETIYANTIRAADTGFSFRAYVAGQLSENAASGDITFTLRYGTTDVIAVATTGLQAEALLPFKVEFSGTMLSTGFLVGVGFVTVYQAATLQDGGKTALTGVDTSSLITADGSMNVTATWDTSHGTNQIIVTHGWIQFYN